MVKNNERENIKRLCKTELKLLNFGIELGNSDINVNKFILKNDIYIYIFKVWYI